MEMGVRKDVEMVVEAVTLTVADVEAYPFASGGIAGADGAVTD